MHTGKITKIVWVVIDVEFNDGYVPSILEALEVKGHTVKVVLETQQQLGAGVVRTIAMGATDGLKRGLEVEATESPIRVPVGEKVLWRMFNVLGDPIDGLSGEPDIVKSTSDKVSNFIVELTLDWICNPEFIGVCGALL